MAGVCDSNSIAWCVVCLNRLTKNPQPSGACTSADENPDASAQARAYTHGRTASKHLADHTPDVGRVGRRRWHKRASLGAARVAPHAQSAARATGHQPTRLSVSTALLNVSIVPPSATSKQQRPPAAGCVCAASTANLTIPLTRRMQTHRHLCHATPATMSFQRVTASAPALHSKRRSAARRERRARACRWSDSFRLRIALSWLFSNVLRLRRMRRWPRWLVARFSRCSAWWTQEGGAGMGQGQTRRIRYGPQRAPQETGIVTFGGPQNRHWVTQVAQLHSHAASSWPS